MLAKKWNHVQNHKSCIMMPRQQHINGNCTNIVFYDCFELKHVINFPCSLFYLPRHRTEFISTLLSSTFSQFRSRIKRKEMKHIIIGENFTIVCSVCVSCVGVYKNAWGHKSCFELLLNICVNVLFTLKMLLRFIAKIFAFFSLRTYFISG